MWPSKLGAFRGARPGQGEGAVAATRGGTPAVDAGGDRRESPLDPPALVVEAARLLLAVSGGRDVAVYVRRGDGCELAAAIGQPPPLGEADWRALLSTAADGGAERRDAAVPCAARGLIAPLTAAGAVMGAVVLVPANGPGLAMTGLQPALALIAGQLRLAGANRDLAAECARRAREADDLRTRVSTATPVSPPAGAVGAGRIIGSSPALRRVLAVVARVAPSDASVLITGETGTGKELIAQAIHERSARRHRPLVSLNCPAIPSTLAESELFGHERGAFTDAVAARPGRFEQADGGTLFLDEIGDLSLAVQAKLLRTLQERETQRIGAAGTRRVDVRVIAATNRDLRAASRHGRFREDLYFRLAAVEIALPPLRDRPGDVAMLAAAFLQRAATQYRRAVGGFSAEAMQLLASYAWPGNVRELQHAVGQAVLLCDGEVICPEHLPRLREAECGPTLRMAIREDKRRYISDALAQNDGNQAAAARALGMSRANLARAMKSLGIAAPRAPSEEAGV